MFAFCVCVCGCFVWMGTFVFSMWFPAVVPKTRIQLKKVARVVFYSASKYGTYFLITRVYCVFR